MFTGIIEKIGTIREIRKSGSNIDFCIASSISNELKIDQSVAHNGVCLTITNQTSEHHWVTAVEETILKTSLSDWKMGDVVNLERCLKMGDRLDGHWVQGHVDTTVKVMDISTLDGSWMYQFSYPAESKHLLVPKGSVCINGVSLTVVDVTNNSFSVTIIPYTFENTQFQALKVNDRVNIEWDILGKYLWNFYSKK